MHEDRGNESGNEKMFRTWMLECSKNLDFPALKAPAYTSPGQRPGFDHESITLRPERARESSALSGRATIPWLGSRGVAPG